MQHLGGFAAGMALIVFMRSPACRSSSPPDLPDIFFPRLRDWLVPRDLPEEERAKRWRRWVFPARCSSTRRGGRPSESVRGRGMSERPIGLMTAIPEEIEDFAAGSAGRQGDRGGAVPARHRRRTAGGRGRSGIGKVHAAIVATLLLTPSAAAPSSSRGWPAVSTPSSRVGDVVVADRLVAHDYGALLDVGIRPYQPGVRPLPGFPDASAIPWPQTSLDRLRPALEGPRCRR